MPVVDRTGTAAADSWVRVVDEDAVPAGASAVVSFGRLKTDHNAVFAAAGAVGIEIAGDADLDEIAPFLPRLKLIVVRFASMRDGRVFSVGRLLRERYAYGGDLRAAGDFIPDQVLFLLRCGFSTFTVADTFSLDAFKRAVAAYTAWYQRAADRTPIAADLRRDGNAG